jgi:hypothetical protein
VEVGGAQRCAPRLIRTWVRPDGVGRPAGPPRGPGGGRVSEPGLSPSLVMQATETGVASGLTYNVQPACDTRVAGRGRDLDGVAGRIRCAAHRVRNARARANNGGPARSNRERPAAGDSSLFPQRRKHARLCENVEDPAEVIN